MNALNNPSELPHNLYLGGPLACRLARAKAWLDSLEHDTASKDGSALAAARVEFALASRALADDLIAQGLHRVEDDN